MMEEEKFSKEENGRPTTVKVEPNSPSKCDVTDKVNDDLKSPKSPQIIVKNEFDSKPHICSDSTPLVFDDFKIKSELIVDNSEINSTNSKTDLPGSPQPSSILLENNTNVSLNGIKSELPKIHPTNLPEMTYEDIGDSDSENEGDGKLRIDDCSFEAGGDQSKESIDFEDFEPNIKVGRPGELTPPQTEDFDRPPLPPMETEFKNRLKNGNLSFQPMEEGELEEGELEDDDETQLVPVVTPMETSSPQIPTQIDRVAVEIAPTSINDVKHPTPNEETLSKPKTEESENRREKKKRSRHDDSERDKKKKKKSKKSDKSDKPEKLEQTSEEDSGGGEGTGQKGHSRSFAFDTMLHEAMFQRGEPEAYSPNSYNTAAHYPDYESYDSESDPEHRDKRRKRRKHRRSRSPRSPPRKATDGMCRFFTVGNCQRGKGCPYIHEGQSPRKMELCKFYLMNCCAKRDKCLYMHKDFPCKFHHTGMKCVYGDNCSFSHEGLHETTRNILLKHLEMAPKDILGDFPRLTKPLANAVVQITELKRRGSTLHPDLVNMVQELAGRGFKYVDRALKSTNKKKKDHDSKKRKDKETSDSTESSSRSKKRHGSGDGKSDRKSHKHSSRRRGGGDTSETSMIRGQGMDGPPSEGPSTPMPPDRGEGDPRGGDNHNFSNNWYSSDDEHHAMEYSQNNRRSKAACTPPYRKCDHGGTPPIQHQSPRDRTPPPRNYSSPPNNNLPSTPTSQQQPSIANLDLSNINISSDLANVLSALKNRSSSRGYDDNPEMKENRSIESVNDLLRSSREAVKSSHNYPREYNNVHDYGHMHKDPFDNNHHDERDDRYHDREDHYHGQQTPRSMLDFGRDSPRDAPRDRHRDHSGSHHNDNDMMGGGPPHRGGYDGRDMDDYNHSGNNYNRGMDPMSRSHHGMHNDQDYSRGHDMKESNNISGFRPSPSLARDPRLSRELSSQSSIDNGGFTRSNSRDPTDSSQPDRNLNQGGPSSGRQSQHVNQESSNNKDVQVLSEVSSRRNSKDSDSSKVANDSTIYNIDLSLIGNTHCEPSSMMQFKVPMHTAAKEIDASITSHSPMFYKVVAITIPKSEYSSVLGKINREDPRNMEDPRIQVMLKQNSNSNSNNNNNNNAGLNIASTPKRINPNPQNHDNDQILMSPVYDQRGKSDMRENSSSSNNRDPRAMTSLSRDPRMDSKPEFGPVEPRFDPRKPQRSDPRQDPRMLNRMGSMDLDPSQQMDMRNSDPRLGNIMFPNHQMDDMMSQYQGMGGMGPSQPAPISMMPQISDPLCRPGILGPGPNPNMPFIITPGHNQGFYHNDGPIDMLGGQNFPPQNQPWGMHGGHMGNM